jgi:DNA-binding transcriptional LysR family regulator
MDRLTSMAIYVRAVERGSLSAAAEDFDISATMAGKHLRALEERLGAKLLNRTTRRQSLTELGREYYERCKQILGEVQEAEESASLARSEPRGVLRISAPVSFGSQRLAPALADYLEAYPQVDVDLVLNDRVVDLVEERFEAAIRIGPLPDSGLIARALAPYRSVVCASPAYLARRGTPRLVEDLAGHNCLGFAYWTTGQEWNLYGPQGRETVAVSGRLQANNGQALRMAALSGLGIIMQPEVLLAEDLDAGRLVRLLPEHQPLSRPVHLVYMPDRRLTPKLRSFIDFVVARFGES